MIYKIENNEVANAMYAGTLLMSNLDSFIKNNYICVNCDVDRSDSNENTYNFEFSSNTAKRKISIFYNTPTNETKLHYFYISIDSKDDRVSLDSLIKEHELFENIDYLDLDNHEGNTKEKILSVIKFIDKVFNENFPNIINGKEWENIAFDWQGYK